MTQARTTTMTESFVDQAKKLGEDLKEAGTKLFHAGLGVVATTEEQARETFDRMVDKGQDYGSDEDRLVSRATREVKELREQVGRRVEDAVSAALNRAGVPSREEINQLSSRVEALTRKVEELAAKPHVVKEESHA